MLWLLAEWRAGRMAPVPVELRPLPSSRSPAVPAVAEFFRVVRGLRLRVDNDEPVPFASGWVADQIGYPKPTVWRALKVLIEAKVLVHPPERHLPGRNERRGTDLFLPGGGDGDEPPRPPARADCGGGSDPNGDELAALFIEMFDAEELDGDTRLSPLAIDCEHPTHAGREWRRPGGRWVCGVCHPPAADPVEWRAG